MELHENQLPRVSAKVYDALLLTFPPMSHNDLKTNTNITELHRRAGQLEVVDFISRVIKQDHSVEHITTFRKKLYKVKNKIRKILRGLTHVWS